MTINKNQNISKFLPTNKFKSTDSEEFDLNKYSKNSSKGCVLKVDLEYPKELHELHNDYPLAPDKTKIKEAMSNLIHKEEKKQKKW